MNLERRLQDLIKILVREILSSPKSSLKNGENAKNVIQFFCIYKYTWF